MKRPRAAGAAGAYLEIFVEYLLAAAAEAVFTALGWIIVRIYRRFKRRKKK